MDVGGPAWDEGVRAWRRLAKRAGSSPTADGAELDTLSDVAVVRRLLDHMEMTSVKVARGRGKSWAEIATNLGVTRQSAWERWRDLDETTDLDRVVDDAADQVLSDTAKDLGFSRPVGMRHRKSPEAATVAVPDVISLSIIDAHAVIEQAGLVVQFHNEGKGARRLKGELRGTVVDQVPKVGARRRPGSAITLWVERGDGSAGVREPRRPVPSPKSAQAETDENDVAPLA